jgi:hypothetical protein
MRPPVSVSRENVTPTVKGLFPTQMSPAGGTTVTVFLKAAMLDSPRPEQQDDSAVAAICSVKGLGKLDLNPAGQL